MIEGFVVYGSQGTGSVAVEAALTLAGAPFRSCDTVEESLNPMRQSPALALPGGEILTESAAILIWLAEAFPEARLSPQAGDAGRPNFLRWMAFVSAQIYGLYWIRDKPSRICADAAHERLVRERSAARIADCWETMDRQISPGRYLLGDDLTVLDLYVTVLSRWGPRRRTFYRVAPKMTDTVRRIDADPRLTSLWAQRFAFVDGWEG